MRTTNLEISHFNPLFQIYSTAYCRDHSRFMFPSFTCNLLTDADIEYYCVSLGWNSISATCTGPVFLLHAAAPENALPLTDSNLRHDGFLEDGTIIIPFLTRDSAATSMRLVIRARSVVVNIHSAGISSRESRRCRRLTHISPLLVRQILQGCWPSAPWLDWRRQEHDTQRVPRHGELQDE